MDALTGTLWAVVALLWISAGAFVSRRVVSNRAERRELERMREACATIARDVRAGIAETQAIHFAHDAPEELQYAATTVQLGGAIADVMPQRSANGRTTAGQRQAQRFLMQWQTGKTFGLRTSELIQTQHRDIAALLARQAQTTSALAGARVTEILLIALPIGAVWVGESMGFQTYEFYSGGPIGALLALAASLLAIAGVVWTEILVGKGLGAPALQAERSPEHTELQAHHVVQLCDLAASLIEQGVPDQVLWEQAWKSCIAVYPAVESADMDAVVAMLRMGTGSTSWKPALGHPFLGPIGRMVQGSARSGGVLAISLREYAEYLRAGEVDAARSKAERIMVAIAAPLALCFLPAFVLGGLLPVAIGLAASTGGL